MNVGDLTRAVESATSAMPTQSVLDRLTQVWPSITRPLRESLDARMNDRLDTITKQLEDRRVTEAEDVGKVLLELEGAIRKELDELAPNHRQLELPLFSDEEKDQYQRDISSLRARLARIPTEIKNEQATVHARYQNLKARLFPVAVTFLIPEQLG